MSRHVDGMRQRIKRLREEMNKLAPGRNWTLVLHGDEPVPAWLPIQPQDEVFVRRLMVDYLERDENASIGYCVNGDTCYSFYADGRVVTNKVH